MLFPPSSFLFSFHLLCCIEDLHTLVKMDTSFTDSPTWIKKMKWRFSHLDVDKNGIVDNADLAIVAKKLAALRNEGPGEEKHYYQIVKAISLIDEEGVTEEEFVKQAKTFVSLPDAKERLQELADAGFKIMDINNDGVISYEEYLQFYKSLNMKQETINELFKKADTNGDGVVDYQESCESFFKFFLSA